MDRIVKLSECVTYEVCISKLKYNKEHYGTKALDMQIFFVAQLFGVSYEMVLREMEK